MITHLPGRVSRPGGAPPRHQELREAAAQQLLRSVQVLRRILKQARAAAPAPDERPLSDAQFYVLQLLTDEPQLAPGDLAVRCAVSDPAMSKILNVLEDQGLVARHTDPANRRSVRVTVTPAGQQELARATRAWLANLARALDPLTDTQLQEVITALGHLASLGAAADPA
ncbi:MAG TPA: MarR family transcriptional regulator [Chloroflexia bacterium]|nr:MarR family transcriptional regulator [Chloroflexia bacterium]